MLPSGNDAALTIAENLGQKLISQNRGYNKRVIKTEEHIQIVYDHKHNPVKAFVREMNKQVQRFRLKDTQFTNPHGLSDKGNHSTSYDIGTLAYQCMKDSLFNKIVSTKRYECSTFVPKKSSLTQTLNPEHVPEVVL